ncbi:MAG: Fur family transcriptional regulator [Anaerolineae bacterium]|jgi:Fur family ferric uptake transcriptional regulator
MDKLSKEKILRQLSHAGYRITQPRRAVIQALLEDEGNSSPAEVHQRARSHCPTIGLVTVYRTLDLLAEMGFVRRIHTDDGCHRYATTRDGHLHHLVCRQCGTTVQVEGCDLSTFLTRISRETGYEVEDHLLELIGLCSTCR